MQICDVSDYSILICYQLRYPGIYSLIYVVLDKTPIFKVFTRVLWFPFGWNNIQLDVFTFSLNNLSDH